MTTQPNKENLIKLRDFIRDNVRPEDIDVTAITREGKCILGHAMVIHNPIVIQQCFYHSHKLIELRYGIITQESWDDYQQKGQLVISKYLSRNIYTSEEYKEMRDKVEEGRESFLLDEHKQNTLFERVGLENFRSIATTQVYVESDLLNLYEKEGKEGLKKVEFCLKSGIFDPKSDINGKIYRNYLKNYFNLKPENGLSQWLFGEEWGMDYGEVAEKFLTINQKRLFLWQVSHLLKYQEYFEIDWYDQDDIDLLMELTPDETNVDFENFFSDKFKVKKIDGWL